MEQGKEPGPKYKKSNEVPKLNDGEGIPYLFGNKLLEEIDRFNRPSLGFEKESILVQIEQRAKRSQEKSIKESFDYIRQTLYDQYDHPRFKQGVYAFLSENRARKKMEALLLGGKRVSVSRRPIPTKEEVLQISDEELERLLRVHKTDFELTLERSKKLIIEFHSRFANKAEEKVASEKLPISHDFLRQRIEETKVTLIDALLEKTQDQGGSYNEKNGVFLSEQDFFPLGEEIYTHEMFHALSGRTIITKVTNFTDMADELGLTKEDIAQEDIRGERVGLFFRGKKRFFWLNEAVTESLKQELLVNNIRLQKHLTYKDEIRLFNLLVGKGQLDRKLFLEAYFENYDTNAPVGQKIPAWKRLSKAITDAYGSGFLVRLDKLVQRQGVKSAIEIFEKDWRQI